MKKLAITKLAFALIASLVIGLTGCSSTNKSEDASNTQKKDVELFEKQLKALPNIVSVETITIDEDIKDSFKSAYSVTFTSKLDPFDSSNTATFKQRAIIAFAGTLCRRRNGP